MRNEDILSRRKIKIVHFPCEKKDEDWNYHFDVEI